MRCRLGGEKSSLIVSSLQTAKLYMLIFEETCWWFCVLLFSTVQQTSTFIKCMLCSCFTTKVIMLKKIVIEEDRSASS